jgi:hypothetical protein
LKCLDCNENPVHDIGAELSGTKSTTTENFKNLRKEGTSKAGRTSGKSVSFSDDVVETGEGNAMQISRILETGEGEPSARLDDLELHVIEHIRSVQELRKLWHLRLGQLN